MSEQQTKEFVIGGREIIPKVGRRYIPERDSYYFPPDSLHTLINELISQNYWLISINVTYRNIRDPIYYSVHKKSSELSQLFGIKLFEGDFYISNLEIEGGGKRTIYTPEDFFKLELKNLLKQESDRRCIAGGSDRWHHYKSSWTEVHAKISGRGEIAKTIEDMVRKSAVLSEFKKEEWKDE